jgi:inhibitor of cysteine peptidase
MRFRILVVFLGLALSGSAPGAHFELAELDVGKELILRRGDSLTVHLPSNPSTGYSWSFTFTKPDILTPGKAGEIQYPLQGSERRIVGAGGNQDWFFRAMRSGKTKILFVSTRPWEIGVVPARTIAWPVSVKE